MTAWWIGAAAVMGGLSAREGRSSPVRRTGDGPGWTLWPAAVCLLWGALLLLGTRLVWPAGTTSPLVRVALGATTVALGAGSLLRRLAGRLPHHSHGAPQRAHSLSPDRLTQDHAHPDRSHASGFAGRLLPSPAAMAVLLLAAAPGDIREGLMVLLSFCAALVITGLAAEGAHQRRSTHWLASAEPLPGWALALSPLLVIALGGALAWTGLREAHGIAAGPLQGGWGTVLAVSGLGLVLGMRHSTDADHVVAISTIVSKQRGILNAALIGSMWGLGHTITIFAVGALIILAGITIPPRIGLAMEFSVALMLILLGCLNLTGVTARLMQRLSPSAREAGHDDLPPEPPESQGVVQGWVGRLGIFQLVRPLAIGLVHGLAGSAAVALMVLSTIHNPVWATIYLLIFGFGTVLGMMVMTSAMAVPLTYAGSRAGTMSRYFGITSGLISVCFGLFLVYQLGFVGGLFTSHPQWTPQ